MFAEWIMNKWKTNYLTVISIFQKEIYKEEVAIYANYTLSPKIQGKATFFPNERILWQPCNQSQTANDKTSVTTEIKLTNLEILFEKKK